MREGSPGIGTGGALAGRSGNSVEQAACCIVAKTRVSQAIRSWPAADERTNVKHSEKKHSMPGEENIPYKYASVKCRQVLPRLCIRISSTGTPEAVYATCAATVRHSEVAVAIHE